MSRTEFMEKLKNLLADIPESEREEALNYYEDYFDDAGVENEQEVIASLGTPEKVARTIKEGLNDGAGEKGEFSETGFKGYGDPKMDEVGYRKKSFGDRIKGMGTPGLVIALIFGILVIPVLGPLLLGVISAAFGIFIAILAVIFSVAIAGIAMIAAGVALFVSAVPSLFASPALAAMLFGGALLAAGLGLLLAILGIWIAWKVMPALIRWFIRVLQKIFSGKGNA